MKNKTNIIIGLLIVSFINCKQQAAISILNENALYAQCGYNNDQIMTNGELDVIKHLIHDGDLVFDVGANIGKWSMHVMSLHNNIILYAFEPTPSVFEVLKREDKLSDAHFHSLALGNVQGEALFFTYSSNNEVTQLNSLYMRPVVPRLIREQPQAIKVPVDTVDNFCISHGVSIIDFMKIDTEGAELSVLQGSKEMLKNHAIKGIQFEYGGTYKDAHTSLREVYELLKAYGYTVYRILPQGLLPLMQWCESFENFMYSNYIALANNDSKKV